ncbi:MAG: hypothetical protein KME64_00310 [Scytonematopsis contorta HA4267-MV1]|jgi:hypothetical protein|nr:hypothetical protein [Scytonematopsis contorta HA4267-MV1]
MKNYIENIRKSVKQEGYNPTSDQIRKAINSVCPDGENILENKADIVSYVIKMLKNNSELITNNSEITSLPTEDREINTPVVADIDNPTSSEIAASVENFLPSKQEPMEETAIQPVEQATEENSTLLPVEENYTPESSSDLVISDQEKNLEINLQAIELGFALTSEQIALVADELDNQFVSEDEFIAAVKEELIRFIDYQTEQSNTKFTLMLGEVENYSSGKKVKRLENMLTNLQQSLTRLQHQDKFFQRRTLSTIDMLRKKKSKSIQV